MSFRRPKGGRISVTLSGCYRDFSLCSTTRLRFALNDNEQLYPESLLVIRLGGIKRSCRIVPRHTVLRNQSRDIRIGVFIE